MKKIFSLFAAVLMAGSMMAGVLVEYNGTATLPTGVTISGTTVMTNVKIHTNKDGVNCIQLANGFTASGVYNGNAIILHTEGGFKAGDTLSVTGFFNNSDDTKESKVTIFTLGEGNACSSVWTSEQFINGRTSAADPTAQTYVLEADLDSIMLGRVGGTGTNLMNIKVTRPEAAPENACDWANIAFLGDGAQGGALSNKYKMCAPTASGIVNIQRPGFAAEDGIYCNFPTGITACSLPEGKYAIQGAGISVYISAFTAKYTDFTVTCGETVHDVTVFYADGTEGEPTSSWDGTVTLSKTTFTSLADLEGLQLTFNGAISVDILDDEEAGGIIFQNEDGSDIYAAWGPAYGGTSSISGNVVTLNGWYTGTEPLPTTSGSVYFEDYGNFIIDGEDEYFETIEAYFEAAPAVTYTVTYTVTGAVAGEAAAQAGYYNATTEAEEFVADANTVPENMIAYVYVQMIEGYTVEVKVNDAAVTLTEGYWEGAINADMTIDVTFTAPEEEEENPYASIYTSNVTFTAGTNSYLTDKINIGENQYDAFKIGTAKNTGNCTITLPAGTEHLYIHATGWSLSETTTMTVSGAGLNATETLAYYLNISGNSPYTVDAARDASKAFFAYDFATPLAEAATVTLSGNARVVFFGVNAVGANTPTAVENVEAVKAVKVIENGQIVIIREGVRYNAAGLKL